MKVGVNNVKKVKDKSVLFELINDEECEEFIQNIENTNNDLKAIIPKKHNLRIIMRLRLCFLKKSPVDAIVEQNPHVQQCMLDPSQQMKKLFMKCSRNGRAQFAVLEMTSMIYHAITASEKLYISYSRCRVQDYITVMRCYNCSGFGHTARDCSAMKNCSQCADNHNESECPRDKVECINCK